MSAIDLVTTAMFTGIGVSIGSLVSELWVKPHIERMHKNGTQLIIKDLQARLDRIDKFFGAARDDSHQ